ncbi:unnamed protein product [Colias eurytheme]|nr:unnamed protein product [Colias eurytheme]
MLCRGVSHKVSGLRAAAPRISFAREDEDGRRKSAFSRLGASPRSSLADDRDGFVLRVPTPRGSVSSTGSSTTSRIARLLTQVRAAVDDAPGDATPRRLSWERREGTEQLPRSTSIDSVVEAALSARRSEPAPALQLPLSLVSPRAKTQRGQAG